MCRASLISFWAVAALTSGTLLARETYNERAIGMPRGLNLAVGEIGGPKLSGAVLQNGAVPGVSLAAGAIANAGASNQSAGDPANRWRYRYHNGRWWYYGVNKRWSYWNGKTWMAYNRPARGQRSGAQLRIEADENRYDYGYGRRPEGFIQGEKNAARGQGMESLSPRRSGTIQREKNDVRGQPLEPIDLRPEGTIQSEKNNARGR